MPFDNRNEQLRIFAEVLQLTSFNQNLGQPTVSNWFAWNSMAEKQIREFNATNCIFAALCVEDGDPGEGGPSQQRLQGSEGTAAGDIEGWRGRCARVQAYEERPEQARKNTLCRRAGVLDLVHKRN